MLAAAAVPPGAEPLLTSTPARPIVIDHRAVADFERIPDEFVRAAATRRFLLRSASIGWNMDQGLNCLANHFPDRPRRPSACDRGIPPGQVVHDAKYDRRNWTIELRGNPGWWAKVADFVTRVSAPSVGEPLDVVGFNFNYGDGLPGSTIVERFFRTAPDARFGNVATLEALEKAHPDKVVVWWSMALPRRSSNDMQAFNRQIRAYAVANRKVFLDIADIESHAPDGTPCTDNQGAGLEALCAEYTRERQGGHLNAPGSQRMAKAIWVLMARIAGWSG